MSAIQIIATIPHEFFIIEREEETVRKASLIEAPTMGTKLLIANRAVLMERESAPCDSMLLKEKININTDITKTVTDVNVFLTSFEIVPNSIPPSAFIQLNIRQRLTSGSINATKKPSTTEINNTIDAFVIPAELILPPIICNDAIIGANEVITLQTTSM